MLSTKQAEAEIENARSKEKNAQIKFWNKEDFFCCPLRLYSLHPFIDYTQGRDDVREVE
jgi:hypothetical protein